ncbi:MAG: T9SS type A sorting domain-containing protein [Bacteroidia bacterium]
MIAKTIMAYVTFFAFVHVNPAFSQCQVVSTGFTQPTCFNACNGSATFSIPSACTGSPMLVNIYNCQTTTTYTISAGTTSYTATGLCGCANPYSGGPSVWFTDMSGFNYYGYFSYYTVPPICIISTDSTSNYAYNILTWNNSSYIDSFIVHRYNNSTFAFDRIGAISRHAVSQFKDSLFNIGGPNGGDPNKANWTYALSARDLCGSYSAHGPAIETIFLQQNDSLFTFSDYLDSANVFFITGYGFYRDTTGTGNYFRQIASMSSTSTQVFDYNWATYPNSIYRVDAFGPFNCNPSAMKLSGGNNSIQGAVVKSRSNVKNNRLAGINSYSKKRLKVYPNPANNTLNIVLEKNENAQLEIYDVIGNRMISKNLSEQTTQLDISSLPAGMFEVKVTSKENIVYRERLIKQ